MCDVQTDGSVPYVSKLEEFETFVAHSKLATLSLRPTLAVQQPESSSLPSQASGNPVKVSKYQLCSNFAATLHQLAKWPA